MKLFKNGKLMRVKLKTASSFYEKFMGLMGRKIISQHLFVYFPFCNAIHTCFMKMPIDVIMTDINDKIVFLREKIRPWKIIICFKAKATLEMKAGSIKLFKLKLKDKVQIQK
ncbi:MAG: DUF192 domain-containing protein [bacterium]